jgi:hypothetical protein
MRIASLGDESGKGLGLSFIFSMYNNLMVSAPHEVVSHNSPGTHAPRDASKRSDGRPLPHEAVRK